MPRNPLHTLLRLAIAFIWLWTGLVVLFLTPTEESVALIAPLGLPERAALLLIVLLAVGEILLGGLTLINWRVRLWSVIQIGLIVAFTLALTIKAGPAMSYMEETVRNLQQPTTYIDAVINARRAGAAEPGGPDGGGGI